MHQGHWSITADLFSGHALVIRLCLNNVHNHGQRWQIEENASNKGLNLNLKNMAFVIGMLRAEVTGGLSPLQLW